MHSTHSAGQVISLFTQFRPDPSPPPRNQLVVPKTNQKINEPSYEMVGVKITVTNYEQYKEIISCMFYLKDYQLQ
jgi:hypothetical protein